MGLPAFTMNNSVDSFIARENFARYLAPEVTLHLMGTDQEAHGPEAVEGLIRYIHKQAFDAYPELKTAGGRRACGAGSTLSAQRLSQDALGIAARDWRVMLG